MPVDARQAEVEQDDVGVVTGGQLERVLARLGEVDLVAAAAQVGRQRATDRRLVVDDQHRVTGATHSRAQLLHVDEASCERATIVGRRPPGVSSIVELAAHRLTKPRAMGNPRPTPAPSAVVDQALERLEDEVPVGRRMPGPRSTTRISTTPGRPGSHRRRSPGRAPPARRTARRCPRGWPPTARAARRRQPPSGSASGTSTSTAWAAGPRLATRGHDHLLEPVGRRSTSAADACSRLMSSRLSTRLVSRSVSDSIVSRNSWTVSGGHSMSS